MRRSRRGYSLIELMVAVAVLSLGCAFLVSHFNQYQLATRRTLAAEGVTRLLDQEMERLRSCPDLACVRSYDTGTSTTAAAGDIASSWVRARVTRSIEPGPGNTWKVVVGAEVPGLLRERRMAALLWVKR